MMVNIHHCNSPSLKHQPAFPPKLCYLKQFSRGKKRRGKKKENKKEGVLLSALTLASALKSAI